MHEVIESFSASKTGVEIDNEDGFVVTDTVVAVFDGATDKYNSQAAEKPGRLATKALLEAARHIASNASPRQIVSELQSAIEVTMRECDLDEPAGFVAVGAVAHMPSKKVIRVGDISVGLDGVFDTPRKRVDEVAAAARAAMLVAFQKAGRSRQELLEHDLGRELVLPLLRESRWWRNLNDSEYGFAVLDGGSTPDGMIDIFDFSQASELVLASDGYPSPQPTLAQSEEWLADLIERDPLQIGPPPGTKGVTPGNISFDDRTYVRVKVT